MWTCGPKCPFAVEGFFKPIGEGFYCLRHEAYKKGGMDCEQPLSAWEAELPRLTAAIAARKAAESAVEAEEGAHEVLA